MKDEQLIFIISQPRAGSTFFQKVLSNNNDVATTSEPWILLQFAPFFKPELVNTTYNFKITNQAFSDYTKKFEEDEVFKGKIKEQLLGLYQKAIGTQKFFLDKTPRYYEIANEIIDLFPNAKFIVLKRHPLAVLNSMIATWSSNKVNFNKLSSFSRDFLKAPFMVHDFLSKNIHNPNVLHVKYEELIAQPSDSIQSIYNWLGINYTEEVLDFSKNKKVEGLFGDDVYGVNKHPSFKTSPVTENELAWLEQLQNVEIKDFLSGYSEFLGAKFLLDYGYSEQNLSHQRSKIFKKFCNFLKFRKLSNVNFADFIRFKLNCYALKKNL